MSSRDSANVFSCDLARIACNTRSAEAVSKTAKFLLGYGGKSSKEVSTSLSKISYYTGNTSVVLRTLDLLEKCKNAYAEIANSISSIAFYTKKPEVVLKTINIISDEKVIDALNMYKGKASEGIAYAISRIAFYTEDKQAVLQTAAIMSNKEIVDAVHSYEGIMAKEIASSLSRIALNTRNARDLLSLACSISKYNQRTAAFAARIISYSLGVPLNNKEKSHTLGTLLKIIDMAVKSGKIEQLNQKNVARIIENGIGGLITDAKSLKVCLLYANSDEFLPLPTKENINSYTDIVNVLVKEKYGIRFDLPEWQIQTFLSSRDEYRTTIAFYVNRSERRDERTYTVSSNGVESGFKVSLVDKENIKINAITSIIGSPNAERFAESKLIIGSITSPKAVDSAFTQFSQNYRDVKGLIVGAVKSGDIDSAIDILLNTGNESIKNIIDAVLGKSVNINQKGIMISAISTNPLDFDSRVQSACVYFPNGINAYTHKKNVIAYITDPKIDIIAYSQPNMQPHASAICYLDSENGIFVVDSLEGSARVRNYQEFKIIRRDLEGRAASLGMDTVAYNSDVTNETPKRFIEYLKREEGLGEGKIKVAFNTDAFLESKREMVRGLIVRVGKQT
ncbi:MAG: hypothetical protein QXF01_00770 [Candidatus Micrarchaeaceae archaeon]